jgi:SAM-dependent methyltransferase
MEWLSLVRCPKCSGALAEAGNGWACDGCATRYPSAGRVPDLVAEYAEAAHVEDDYEDDPRRSVGRVRRVYNAGRRAFEVSLIAAEAQRHGRLVDVVDVGSGDPTQPGGYHARIRPFARRLLGIEPSRPVVLGATPTASVGVVRAIGELPVVREASADVILSFSALDHCLDPHLTLVNMATALRPGGLAIVDLKNAAAWYRPLYDRAPRWLKRRVAPHEHEHPWSFSPALLAPRLLAAGFVDVAFVDAYYAAPFAASAALNVVPTWSGEHACARALAAIDRVGHTVAPGRGGIFIALARTPANGR